MQSLFLTIVSPFYHHVGRSTMSSEGKRSVTAAVTVAVTAAVTVAITAASAAVEQTSERNTIPAGLAVLDMVKVCLDTKS